MSYKTQLLRKTIGLSQASVLPQFAHDVLEEVIGRQSLLSPQTGDVSDVQTPGPSLLTSGVILHSLHPPSRHRETRQKPVTAVALDSGVPHLKRFEGALRPVPVPPARFYPTRPAASTDSLVPLKVIQPSFIRQPTGSGSISVAINRHIMGARSVKELLDVVDSCSNDFDFFNTSTAISRVPKLVHSNYNVGKGSIDFNTKNLLDKLGGLMSSQIASFDARGLANAAWAFGKLRYSPDKGLPEQISAAALRKLDQFSPQNLSNMLWSFVYLQHKDSKLLVEASAKVRDFITQFKPQELSNVIWALASMEYYDENLLRALASQTLFLVHDFKEQELSNTLWAFAKLKYYDKQLFEYLCHHASTKVSLFLPQGVSNIAWALATASHKDLALFEKLANQCAMRISDYDVQALCNLVWSMAAIGYHNETFLALLVDQCITRIDDLSSQNLSNVLWACATMNFRSPKMLTLWSRKTLEKLDQFEPQGISNSAWAFSKLGHYNPALFQSLADVITSKAPSFTSQGLSNIVWAYATAPHYDNVLLDKLSSAIVNTISQFNAQNCSMTVWAFATQRYYSQQLFEAVLHQLVGRSDTCEPQNISNTLWAYARMGHDLGDAAPVLLQQCTRLVDKMNQQELCNCFWALSVMNLLTPALFNLFCSQLMQVQGMTSEGMHQIYQAQLLFHSSLARSLNIPYSHLNPAAVPALPEPLHSHAHRMWLSSARDVRVSRFQADVSQALWIAGLPNTIECLTHDGLFSIDIGLALPQQLVAVEVDGAHHYTANAPHRELSDVALRKQLLQDRGWQVLNVGFLDWEAAGAGLAEKSQWLFQRLLEKLAWAVPGIGHAIMPYLAPSPPPLQPEPEPGVVQ